MKQKVALLLGSKSDLEQAEKIAGILKEFGITYQIRIASAHRTPTKVQQIIKELEDSGEQIVLVAVVGLSNALSGMVAGICYFPLITCPVYDPVDINSSLRMPPGVSHGTVLNPENAAIYAVKILALSNQELRKKIQNYLAKKQQKIEQSDDEIQRKS